jgi:hypothetical protein
MNIEQDLKCVYEVHVHSICVHKVHVHREYIPQQISYKYRWVWGFGQVTVGRAIGLSTRDLGQNKENGVPIPYNTTR